MRNPSVLLFVLALSFSIPGFAGGLSAQREKTPDLRELELFGSGPYSFSRPWNALKDQEDLLRRIPEVSEAMAFEFQRRIALDRILPDPRGGRARRIPWFYPDDGCFMRADRAVRHIERTFEFTPAKVFAFGDLWAHTRHHPNQEVGWWYHVAPVVRVNGRLMVMDPSILRSRPIPLLSWIGKFHDRPDSVRIAFCEASTYDPSYSCRRPDPMGETQIQPRTRRLGSLESHYLIQERRRVKALGQNPDEVL